MSFRPKKNHFASSTKFERANPFRAKGACTDPNHHPPKWHKREEGLHAHVCPTCSHKAVFVVGNVPARGLPRLSRQGVPDQGGAFGLRFERDLPPEQFPESHKFERAGCGRWRRGFGCDFCDMQNSLGRIKQAAEKVERDKPLHASLAEMARVA